MTTKVSGPPLPASGRKAKVLVQLAELLPGPLQQGAQADTACVIRDQQLQRQASVTRQLSRTITDLQDYQKNSEITQVKLKQLNAELQIQKKNLQERSTTLEHKVQQLQQSLINKTAEATNLAKDCAVHASARRELGTRIRDKAKRISILESESKAINKFAYAEQSKAYKASAEADEAEGYRAAACQELQDVKQRLVRARCGEGV
eukprot:COSAG02_NODE_3321_length_6946_cov_1.656346_1_plen_205_part_00